MQGSSTRIQYYHHEQMVIKTLPNPDIKANTENRFLSKQLYNEFQHCGRHKTFKSNVQFSPDFQLTLSYALITQLQFPYYVGYRLVGKTAEYGRDRLSISDRDDGGFVSSTLRPVRIYLCFLSSGQERLFP
jgi:hypothetical protein